METDLIQNFIEWSKKGLIEKVTFEQRLDRGKGII